MNTIYAQDRKTMDEWDAIEAIHKKAVRAANGKGKQSKHNRRALRAVKRAS